MNNDYERAREALNFVSPFDRETWVRMGMGIKDKFGDEGFELWDEWSKTADSYTVGAARSVWKGIQPGGGITVGSVFHEARQNGWTPSAGYQAREISPEEKAERERRIREAREKDERDAKRASEQFRGLWKHAKARAVGTDHPYMVGRGVEPTDSLREIPADAIARAIGYAPKHEDKPLQGRVILVPLKGPNGSTPGGELVDESGLKTVLYGTAPRSGYWSPEQLPGGDGEGLRILIAEGMATALSARGATGDPVLAARTCGNVPVITAMARERWPKAQIVVLGERGGGLRYAEQAARDNGAKLAIFEDDANTEHRTNGLEAVHNVIEDAQHPAPVTIQGPTPENRSGAVLSGPGDVSSVTRAAGTGLMVRTGADIQPERIKWLWLHWLAAGKLHILAGPPGTGKTTLALALAVTLSIGGRWPSREQAPRRRTIIWSAEDGIEDTLVPRLLAMGADMSMVSFVDGVRDERGTRSFDPAQDVPELIAYISRLDDVGLVIVDPIVSAVAADSNKNAEVRRALQPLVDMAGAKDCAVIGISHFSKGTAGREPLERVTGSLAFGALARIVLVATKMEDELSGQQWRLLARAKSNIGPEGGGFKYDLEQTIVPGHGDIEASRVLWGDAVEGSARELLGQAEQAETPDQRDERMSATDFVRSEMEASDIRPCDKHGALSCRVHPASEILKAAERMCLKARTAQAAATRMGVKTIKSGMNGGWEWHLPEGAEDARRREGATPENLASSVPELASSTDAEVL